MKTGDVSGSQEYGFKETLHIVTPNQTLGASTTTNVAMATYTMPFAGKLVVEGYCRVAWALESQYARLGLETSTAAPNVYSEFVHWSGISTSWTYYSEIPFIAQWNSVASGAAVVLRCSVEVGTTGGLTVGALGWTARASQ